MPTPNKVTIPMLIRMRALRDAGLGNGAICAVVALDYGVEIGYDTVRYHLGNRDGSPRGLGRSKPSPDGRRFGEVAA